MTLQAGEERDPRHCSEPTPLVLRPSWAWGSHAPSESAPRQGFELALARCRAHFSKNVHKNGLFVGRKPSCVGHSAGEVAYKQEEQQEHSGRTTPTEGGQQSPSWQMEGHLVVWVRREPRKAGLVKPPTTLPGAAKGRTASRLSRGKDGWACVGSRVAVSQETGTSSSSSLGLTGLPDKPPP